MKKLLEHKAEDNLEEFMKYAKGQIKLCPWQEKLVQKIQACKKNTILLPPGRLAGNITVMRFLKKLLPIVIMLFISLSYITAAPITHRTATWKLNTDDAIGYKLYYGTQPGIYDTVKEIGNTGKYKIEGLQDNTVYYFAATAYDAANNESDYSVEVEHKTDFTSPGIPEDFNITIPNATVNIIITRGGG